LSDRYSQHGARLRAVRNRFVSRFANLGPVPCPFVLELEAMVKTAPELQSEARSNHDAAARALRMARGLTRTSEIERLERFAAELETRANELEAQAAATDTSGPIERM
jgi:hypothetical protein